MTGKKESSIFEQKLALKKLKIISPRKKHNAYLV